MDISRFILRSSLRSQIRRLETKVGGTEEEEHQHITQHHNIGEQGDILESVLSALLFPRSWLAIISYFLHHISAISGGVITVWSTQFDFGFLCSGAGKVALKAVSFFPICYFPFVPLSPFHFRFPTGDLHHEINDVCV